MQIPDTPEQFIETLGAQSIGQVFPQYEKLPIHYQKLLRIIHAELTKGQLNDQVLQGMLLCVLATWRDLNDRAVTQLRSIIQESEDVDTEWFDFYSHLGRIDNYLAILMSVVEKLPALTSEETPDHPITSHYRLRGPGD